GVVLDEALSREAMLEIATPILHKRSPESKLLIGAYIPRTSGGRDLISQPLGFVFTNWRAGIRDMCMSPEEVAAADFRHNAMWTGGACFVLPGAGALALAALRRRARRP